MATNSKKTGTAAKIGVMTLAIMNVAAVVSLRGLPAEAEYGLSSAFLRKKIRLPGYFPAMDRKYHLVSDRIDLRCCIHCLYWHE